MRIDRSDDEILLHSIVDDEATPEERQQAWLRMAQDREFKARSCELSNQKKLLQLAYADIEPPGSGLGSLGKRPSRLLAIAALLVIMIGSGVFVAMNLQPKSAQSGTQQIASEARADTLPGSGDTASEMQRKGQRFVLLDPDGSGQTLADPRRKETRIVFQVSRPDMVKAGEVLDQIEDVLLQYETQGKPVRIELVAYGNGLNLLRRRLTKYADRISDMQVRFDNLVFVACQNTMERYEREQKFAVNLLPHVVISPSGVNHIAQRQAEGWAYIDL